MLFFIAKKVGTTTPKLFKGQLHMLYFLDLFIHSLRDSQVVSIQDMEEAFEQCCHECGSTDISLRFFISFGYIPRNEIAGSYADSAFIFLRNLCCVLHRGGLSLHSKQQCTRVSFFTYPSHIYYTLSYC